MILEHQCCTALKWQINETHLFKIRDNTDGRTIWYQLVKSYFNDKESEARKASGVDEVAVKSCQYRLLLMVFLYYLFSCICFSLCYHRASQQNANKKNFRFIRKWFLPAGVLVCVSLQHVWCCSFLFCSSVNMGLLGTPHCPLFTGWLSSPQASPHNVPSLMEEWNSAFLH